MSHGGGQQLAPGSQDLLNLEAYLKVMQARSIHMRFTKDDNLISRGLTEEAISIDPEYGEAYVLLAATYMLETFFESVKSREQSMRQAIGYAKKAVELETNPLQRMGLQETLDRYIAGK